MAKCLGDKNKALLVTLHTQSSLQKKNTATTTAAERYQITTLKIRPRLRPRHKYPEKCSIFSLKIPPKSLNTLKRF